MVFSSPIFVFLFLPLTGILYFLAPRRARNAILLLASIVFYAWGEQLFVFVVLASVAVNWLLGLLLEWFRGRTASRLLMAGAVIANIGLLGFYKYSGFFVAQFNSLTAMGGWPAVNFNAPHLPLGISFFTFHALSYVIDIYRRDAKAQKNPVDFALYLAFFPQLIAGPIVRYHDISDQLTGRKERFDLAVSGAERALAGFGKKILLANPLGEIADRVFSLPHDQLGVGVAWLGVAAYALQIYLDFSGYSDMAIGLARLFGFNFLENFDYPYRSRSIQEFWRRWHISLSNWFRDYLYIPLGGNRVVEWRVWFNLVFVFLVCGLWHGANWTFVVWGALHGLFLVIERAGFGKVLARLPSAISWFYATAVVTFAWVFFRSDDLGAAWTFLAALAGRGASGSGVVSAGEMIDLQLVVTFALGAAASLGAFTWLTADWRLRAKQSRGEIHPGIDTLRIGSEGTTILVVRLGLLVAIAVFACARMATGAYNPFIYFRF
ncbi:MBOAT family protein [Rhodoblastus acidophilus]|uniref:Probable alginate O-acetylase AlgI n=1 Tax=Candidatus Rhodoblastus alkanivorans TaxID=2954117 RepID=A0ABS9Z4R1_9HYPH|nr:MBOAT family protein [Candidatus Rhodoblastus alkanivorans]MCI4679215.1 MBOAT family protein [Candidatus Rhodoblastus alkanivorans]MCI4682461.1 MBOAT family protein [Candidatus Rhodoblastus alkanivorans]MDI4639767.1 MBOAT family protein [Rhodoblastus acidophilus]